MLKSSVVAIAALFALVAQPVLAADGMPTVTVHPSIDRACQDALHVSPADTQYAACVASLTQTLSMTKKMHEQRSQTACGEAGLTAGTEAYDRCVTNLSGALQQAQTTVN
ncbi:hypothetical protein [Nitrospirillum viridazoti]|uniref:UrcA family protein n=1 Tax=Nitrospirillum amazonense TaxID=28077 RepID=A0A560IX91_9PROT|nr:hypothetical protein [Nitrospirillum amazonense]TWB63281.1 hypothetical protein FBZ92_10435 [Nitrospirillum amazonense]